MGERGTSRASVEVQDARRRIMAATRPVVLTGAGVSAESGVPTFRGAEGLWENFRAEDLATPEAFRRDPVLVWRWYDWRRSLISGLRPNDGHYALAALERKNPALTLITQNVDGLHGVAGSTRVVELHGSIWTLRCTSCGEKIVNRDVPIAILPHCGCGAVLRPDVVWFGETLDPDVIEGAFEAAEAADVMIVAGTSGVVQPAASLAVRAKEAGAFVIEINPEETPLSRIADLRLAGPSGGILPGIVE